MKRRYVNPTSHKGVEPGYHDAHDVSEPMAVVFMKVHKPANVFMAEECLFEENDVDLSHLSYFSMKISYCNPAKC
eukprot:gene28487-31643_t